MPFVTTTGYNWSNGEVITAIKLNAAGLPTIADNQVFGFSNGTAAAPSWYFASDTNTGMYWGGVAGQMNAAFSGVVGATLSATSWALANAGASMGFSVGQDATHALVSTWNYNATAGNATATFGTFGLSNALKIGGKTISMDVASQANFMQVFARGAVLFSAAGADDTVNFLQVQGGFSYDRISGAITALAYASSKTLDFNAGTTDQSITLAGNLTLASTNLGAGRSITLRIIADGSPRTLSFPAGWIFLNAPAPSTIAASKTAVLTMKSYSTTDASVVAAYAVQQ